MHRMNTCQTGELPDYQNCTALLCLWMIIYWLVHTEVFITEKHLEHLNL